MFSIEKSKHILLTNIYVKSIKHTSSKMVFSFLHTQARNTGEGALFDPYFMGPC